MNDPLFPSSGLTQTSLSDQIPDHVKVKSRAWKLTQSGAVRVEPREAIAEIADGDPCFHWIHLDSTAPETTGWLRRLGMPDPVCDALLAGETRPRCEPFPQGAILNLRGPAVVGDADELVSVRAWLGAHFVCSTSRREPVVLVDIDRQWSDGDIRDTGDFVAELAGAIIDHLDPVVAALSDKVDDYEEQIETDGLSLTRSVTNRVRTDAIHLRRFISPQFQALDRARNLRVDWLSDEDRQHIAEAADRTARMGEELETVRERAALLHEQMSDLRAEQTDRRALAVSVVALVALPLTFITGLLGMNVGGIPFSQEPWAFGLVVLICAVIAIASIFWFLHAHWFN